jgi:hypothetical protein
MMDKSPARRPATAYDVEAALIPFCRPGTVPVQPIPQIVATESPLSEVALAEVVPVAESVEEVSDGWGVDASAFSADQPESDVPPRRRPATASDHRRIRLLLLLGALLHITGIGLLVAWALGAFTHTPETDSEPPASKKDEPPKSPKKQRPSPANPPE